MRDGGGLGSFLFPFPSAAAVGDNAVGFPGGGGSVGGGGGSGGGGGGGGGRGYGCDRHADLNKGCTRLLQAWGGDDEPISQVRA